VALEGAGETDNRSDTRLNWQYSMGQPNGSGDKPKFLLGLGSLCRDPTNLDLGAHPGDRLIVRAEEKIAAGLARHMCLAGCAAHPVPFFRCDNRR
jgi:hypothetical protein